LEALTHLITQTGVFVYFPDLAILRHFTLKILPTQFNVLFRQYAVISLLRPPITFKAGTGILTRFSSTSPFGFALDPD